MEIRRHCAERLPGGERLWRKAARIAGFEGTLEVYGFGVKRFNRKEMFSKDRGKYGVTLAYYNKPNKITVFLKTSPCSVVDPLKHKKASTNKDPLVTFCHELGHYQQFIKGRLVKAAGPTLKEWKENPQERSADAYARWLIGQIRER